MIGASGRMRQRFKEGGDCDSVTWARLETESSERGSRRQQGAVLTAAGNIWGGLGPHGPEWNPMQRCGASRFQLAGLKALGESRLPPASDHLCKMRQRRRLKYRGWQPVSLGLDHRVDATPQSPISIIP